MEGRAEPKNGYLSPKFPRGIGADPGAWDEISTSDLLD